MNLRWLRPNAATPAGPWIVVGHASRAERVVRDLATLGVTVERVCESSAAFESWISEKKAAEACVALSAGDLGAWKKSLRAIAELSVFVVGETLDLVAIGRAELDQKELSRMRVALVLPSRRVPPEHIEFLKRWFEHKFSASKDFAVFGGDDTPVQFIADATGWTVEPLPDQDELRKFDVLVFAKPWDDTDHWEWVPFNGEWLWPRLYVLQPWGQFRCVNRPLDTFDFPHADSHVFYRASSADTQSFQVFFPHGVIGRDASLGPTDALGYRQHRREGTVQPTDRRTVCVAFLGGSAAMGQGALEGETIPAQLEAALNEIANRRGGPRFEVWNYGQSATVIASELVTFVMHVERRKPDVVITHDGYNDFQYGQQCDAKLVRDHGLIYHPHCERWGAWLHRTPFDGERQRAVASPHSIVNSYHERRRQLARIVAACGARFVAGLQPFIKSKRVHGAGEQRYLASRVFDADAAARMTVLYHMAAHYIPPEGSLFVNCDAIFAAEEEPLDEFYDVCHHFPAGNTRVARIYADALIAAYGDEWFESTHDGEGAEE
jgi:hypothetical protein